MIPLCSLREESLVLSQLLLIWERDTVDTLQRIVVRITKEVRGRVLAFKVGLVSVFRHASLVRVTFVTMNALIFPVCGICGPTHKSIIGPHRYTVVDVPSGIFDSMMYFLYLLY